MNLRLLNNRHILFLLLVFCLFYAVISGQTAGNGPGQVFALVGGTLIDGTGADPVKDAVVVIRAGRILAAGKRGEVEIPAGAELIKVKNGTILPGFIDAHVHNTTVDNLASWAQAGVTTVRDVGAPEPNTTAVFAIRQRTLTDMRLARLIAAGPLVTVPGGYPIAVNRFPSLAVTSPDDAREKIGRLIDQGADLIKIALEGGLPVLTAEEISAIVETAHARGVPVSAHATRNSTYRLAIEAGVDDIAHSCLDKLDEDLLARMIRQNICLVPTLNIQGGSDRPQENFRRFISAGGQAALGDDAGYLLPVCLPYYDMLFMTLAGMTPMQAIIAGTGNAARVCRRERDLGTVTPGKLADILVVRGDPLKDLRALESVLLVLREGVVIRQES